MSTAIGIMGEPGHGKTTSLRNLDPTSTYIIDADQKGLSWRGWKRQYNEENKNCMKSSDGDKIYRTMDAIDRRAPHIKTLVIDTVNAIMLDDEMRRMKQKNFDKWVDLATSVYNIVRHANELRDDLSVILIFHTVDIRDDDGGYSFTRILTSGRKLQKIKLESKLPILLLAKCRGNNGSSRYIFETQANNSTAKSPFGMFENFEIPNDLAHVLEQVRKYEDGE